MPYLNPSSLSSRSCIFGIGYGVRRILLFSLRKLLMKRTVPSFFGIIKHGAAHLESLISQRTPAVHSQLHSIFKVFLWTFGIGYARAWCGVASGLSSTLYLGPFHLPIVPSNNTLCFLSRFSNFCCST